MEFKNIVFFIFLTISFVFRTECTLHREYLECCINHFDDKTSSGGTAYGSLYIGEQQGKTVGKENAVGLDKEIYTFLMGKEKPENCTLSTPHVKIEFTAIEWEKMGMNYNSFVNPKDDQSLMRTIISEELYTVLSCFKAKKQFFPKSIQRKILSICSELLPAYIDGQYVISNTILLGCNYKNIYHKHPIPGPFLLKCISEKNEFELRRLF